MNNTLLKSILAGLLIGVALFILPFFLIRVALFFLLIGAIFRLFGNRGGRWERGPRRGYMPAFTDRIRQMNDDEYNELKQRFGRGRCGNGDFSKSAEKTTNV